jgi:hypothetical protein
MREPERSVLAMCSVVLATLVTAGCGAARPPPPAVALVVRGEPSARIEAAATKADLGVELRVAHAPRDARLAPGAGVRPTAAEVEERLALARADYVSGELARVRSCAERLGDPELVWSSLARRARGTAARVLIWRIACTSIARHDDAVDAARTFAALDLELPAEVEAIPVEAHRILTGALHDAEATPKRELAVHATGSERPLPGAQVTVDGRSACSTECVASVAPGDHLVQVEKDGWTPSSRTVRVAGDAKRTDVAFALGAAAPDVASAQWASRYGSTRERADANESIALLAQALRARRFVYLETDPLGSGIRIRGALAVDGKIEARDEKQGDVDGASRDVLRELLVKGGIVESKSVFKKPLFWILVGTAAIASSAATAYILYDPGTRTEVRTR